MANSNNKKTSSGSSLYLPIAVVVAGLIIAGAVIFTNSSKAPEAPTVAKVSDTQETGKKDLSNSGPDIQVSGKDHIRGKIDAPITIVEFSDFQCPFCQRFHPTMQQVLDEYPNDVRWVYKHFPLDSIHPQARPTAEASECASEQGKFWEFADAMFENQSKLGKNFYSETAQNLGLDESQFESCVDSRKYKDRVDNDYKEGLSLGVRGTPTSFANGQTIPGAVPYSQVKSIIEGLLE